MSDLPNFIISNDFGFADDTAIIRGIKTSKDCEVMQNDLNNINQYFQKNDLKLNADKTEFLRIELKNSVFQTYSLNNIKLKEVESHKHLGVIYDKK